MRRQTWIQEEDEAIEETEQERERQRQGAKPRKRKTEDSDAYSTWRRHEYKLINSEIFYKKNAKGDLELKENYVLQESPVLVHYFKKRFFLPKYFFFQF